MSIYQLRYSGDTCVSVCLATAASANEMACFWSNERRASGIYWPIGDSFILANDRPELTVHQPINAHGHLSPSRSSPRPSRLPQCRCSCCSVVKVLRVCGLNPPLRGTETEPLHIEPCAPSTCDQRHENETRTVYIGARIKAANARYASI